MLGEKLILHASKDPCHRFVNGFYLYYIVTNDEEGEFMMSFSNMFPTARLKFENSNY